MQQNNSASHCVDTVVDALFFLENSVLRKKRRIAAQKCVWMGRRGRRQDGRTVEGNRQRRRRYNHPESTKTFWVPLFALIFKVEVRYLCRGKTSSRQAAYQITSQVRVEGKDFFHLYFTASYHSVFITSRQEKHFGRSLPKGETLIEATSGNVAPEVLLNPCLLSSPVTEWRKGMSWYVSLY